MNEYVFPFDTCETPNKDGIIAQPYSVLFNVINCVIIFYFLLKTKRDYTFMLLFSILCFELFHTFSHIIHITPFYISNADLTTQKNKKKCKINSRNFTYDGLTFSSSFLLEDVKDEI